MSMNEEQRRESGQSDMVHNTENTQKTSENNVVIEFKNVTFGYHEEATVHSLNVKVKKGDFTVN